MTRRETAFHTTGIQWTHVPGYSGATWNPTVGCTRVSPGCDNCYAFQLHDQRYASNLRVARDAAAAAGMDYPSNAQTIAAARVAVPGKLLPPQYDVPFSTVQLLDEKRLTAPLRARAPRAYFVDSMSDLFHEDVPEDFIDRVFAVMAVAPQHLFMILTKRPDRMRQWVSRWKGSRAILDPRPGENDFLQPWPLPNVWLGTSVEDQQRADERVPLLRQTPAALRFLSCEPLLGPIDLTALNQHWGHTADGMSYVEQQDALSAHEPPWSKIDWVIVGGESGPRARRFDLAWPRSIVAQCRAAGVPVFVKQLGAHPSVDLYRDEQGAEFPTGEKIPLRLRNRHGSDMSEWPEDLRVREFPPLV